MNNYIINPSIFYWMNVLNSIRGIAIVTLFISVACLIIALIFYFVEEDESAKGHYQKLIFISGIVVVISIIIIIFIPDKMTSMEMLIARTATYENAQLTVQGIKKIVDYIIQAINGI